MSAHGTIMDQASMLIYCHVCSAVLDRGEATPADVGKLTGGASMGLGLRFDESAAGLRVATRLGRVSCSRQLLQKRAQQLSRAAAKQGSKKGLHSNMEDQLNIFHVWHSQAGLRQHHIAVDPRRYYWDIRPIEAFNKMVRHAGTGPSLCRWGQHHMDKQALQMPHNKSGPAVRDNIGASRASVGTLKECHAGCQIEGTAAEHSSCQEWSALRRKPSLQVAKSLRGI